jgi:nucleotide-binding universal stress UspA family protein
MLPAGYGRRTAMSHPGRTYTHKVLLAHDGSPAAAKAIPTAIGLADQLHDLVRVLHVIPAGSDIDLRALQEMAALDNVEVLCCRGDIVPRLLHEAKEPAVDVLVLTTHGRNVEPRGRLGHVTEGVIAATTVPVLVVQPETAPMVNEHLPLFKRLLLPLDGTRATASLLRPAIEFAARLKASIDVLYVASEIGSGREHESGQMTAPEYIDQPQHEWPQWASEFLERFCVQCAGCPEDMPLELYLKHGDIAAQIVEFALEKEHDAIILARRSNLEPGRARVLRAVLRQTSCPVLLVGGAESR